MPKALKMKVQDIKLDLIDEPGGIVRMDILPGDIEDLAKNIDEVGLLQPIIVRRDQERFEIIAGHCRFLAFQLLEREKIPCVIRDIDDVGTALARASENIRRIDLSPIEEAATYAELHDKHGLSHDEIGKKMGKSAGIIRRRLDLLRMPAQLQKAVHFKQISYGVAEELWSIGDIGGIDYYLAFAIEHGVTVAVARGWAKDWKDQKRRAESDVGGGGGAPAALEPRPTYLPCDICQGPEDVSKMQLLHCCVVCAKKLRTVLGESQT